MSAGCCLVGKTKEETLKKELAWMAEWATSMLRALRMVDYGLCQAMSVHPRNSAADVSRPADLARMDVITATLSGIHSSLVNDFELGRYGADNNDEKIHESLDRSFADMLKQGKERTDIPVSVPGAIDVKSTKPVTKIDKLAFKTALRNIAISQQILNGLMEKYYKVENEGSLSLPPPKVKCRADFELGEGIVANPVEFDVVATLTELAKETPYKLSEMKEEIPEKTGKTKSYACKAQKPITDLDRDQLRFHLGQLAQTQDDIQKILDNYYGTKDTNHRIHPRVVIKVDTVDANNGHVDTPDIQLDNISDGIQDGERKKKKGK